ncbi:4-hydroxythreonine-4-phosphate dehydrogenase PdxA [Burkholderiaceae bacterium DAT-1]|nr:4-hydroxythreonine-4-phosphate dehydrogenase PdxA [Burkholderiaceae bacterium DAT-1]
MRPTIIIPTGEPAGIGPELCASLDPGRFPARLVLLGDRALLASRAWPGSHAVKEYVPDEDPGHGVLELIHVPLETSCVAGQPSTANAPYVMALLDRAIAGCMSGEFSAMVTAPLHKGVIRNAGYHKFVGHTEYLAEKTGTRRVVMMLAGGGMRVALATTHLPLRDVPDAITIESLKHTLRILNEDLKRKFGLSDPRILVAGLNPHAGESGHMGREELDVIIPAMDIMRKEGLNLIGPLPADTLFNPSQLARGDAVLAMYHDQGLPPLKHASFGHGINITLGLPIIRTSVDHGTAFDLAGKGTADQGSLIVAVEHAVNLALNSRKS